MTKNKQPEHLKNIPRIPRPHIHLVDNYYMTADAYQWMLTKKRKGKNRDTGKSEDQYKPVAFYATPLQVVQSLNNRLLREFECSTLAELQEKSESVATQLSGALEQAEKIKLNTGSMR